MQKVYVIILNFGDKSVTQQCVQTFYDVETSLFHMIIVNNDSYSLGPKDFGNKKNLDLINTKKNVGFAGGVNRGIQYALQHGADYIAIFNNDATLITPLLTKSVNFLSKNKAAGIVAPAIQFRKDTDMLYDVGGVVNPWVGRTHHTEVVKIVDTSPREIEYVSGCCMVVKKEVFGTIGLFDERYFIYYEDVDFCLTARKKGWATYCLPEIVISHALTKTFGRMSQFATYQQIRSGILFGKKYFSRFPKNVLHSLFILLQVLIFLKVSPIGGLGGVRALPYLWRRK